MIPRMGGFNSPAMMYANARMNPQRDNSAEIQQAEAQRESKFQADLAHVQAHEVAHYSAAGEFAAGSPVINADYGKKVVYGGHVPIKMSFGKTAEDAERNANKIASAALSPGDPSSTDVSVAAKARATGSALASQRRAQEKAQQEQPKNQATGIIQPRAGEANPFKKLSPAG